VVQELPVIAYRMALVNFGPYCIPNDFPFFGNLKTGVISQWRYDSRSRFSSFSTHTVPAGPPLAFEEHLMLRHQESKPPL
jgi:hypothetical protein